MKKIPISTIALVAIAAIISGLVSATAATKLFNANEVGYASNRTNINATDVQGAIDELYAKATDYQGVASSIANLTSSVNVLTNKVGNLEKPTWIELNQKGSLSGIGGYIDFHFNGSSSDYTSRIIERNSGELSLFAPNGVKVNNNNVLTDSIETFTATIKGGTVDTNICYKTGRMYTCSFHISDLTSTIFPTLETNLISIPSTYAPSSRIWFNYGYSSNATQMTTYGYLAPSGNIYLTHTNGTVSHVMFSITWVK